MASIDSANQPGLLNVPTEVSQLIYTYLFDSLLAEVRLCVGCGSGMPFGAHAVHILATCHQLREVALPVFKDTLAKSALFLEDGNVNQPHPCYREPQRRNLTVWEDYCHLFKMIHIKREDFKSFVSWIEFFTGLQKRFIDWTGVSELMYIEHDEDTMESFQEPNKEDFLLSIVEYTR